MIGPNDGVLKFLSPPDYEDPDDEGEDNTYVVTVMASDGEEADTFDVTVKVTPVDEDGKVTWTVDHDANTTADEPILLQFQVGAILTASVDDGDVSEPTKTVTVADGRWQWYRSSSKTSLGTPIEDATMASYTVQTSDVGSYLHVKVYYNVGAGREETASVASDYKVLADRTSNSAPEFDPTSVTRNVNESKKGMAVGAPVTATDDASRVLNYTLTCTKPRRSMMKTRSQLTRRRAR